VLPAGSYIRPGLLAEEIALTRLPPSRLVIDRNASVVTSEDESEESKNGLVTAIGSTGSGTGRAVARRVERRNDVKLAQDIPELHQYLGDAPQFLRDLLQKKGRVVIEGSQGIGLSLLHGGEYPFATSRDVSAAGALSETGLSPVDVDEVVLVLRAFPIRVAGNSGSLPAEMTWDEVAKYGGHDHSIVEFTTVTQRVRRVGAFDPDVVRRALAVNRPTTVVMNHLDYIDHHACLSGEPTPRVMKFVAAVENSIGYPIDLMGLRRSSVISRCDQRTNDKLEIESFPLTYADSR